MSDDQIMKRRELMREAVTAVRDLRFIQANSITCLNLEGKAYIEAKSYMLKLADLQAKLEKEMMP